MESFAVLVYLVTIKGKGCIYKSGLGQLAFLILTYSKGNKKEKKQAKGKMAKVGFTYTLFDH